jgi:hypothetical protein
MGSPLKFVDYFNHEITLGDGAELYFGDAPDIAIDFTDGTGLLVVGLASAENLLLGSDTYNLNTTLKGTLTVGKSDTGHDVKLFGATAGAYMLWDESNETLDIVSKVAAATGTTSEDVLKITVTDASTISGNINRGLHIDYTSSGAKTGTAQVNCIGYDLTVSANCVDVMLEAGYLATIADKTIGNLFGYSLYFEDFGNAVTNFCMIDLGYNSPHAPSGRNCFFRCRQHDTVQSGASVLRLEGTNAANYLVDFMDAAGTGQSILAAASDTTDCTYKIAVRLTAHSVTKYIHLFDS